jgi:type II secretory pathway pseudopilin PulG
MPSPGAVVKRAEDGSALLEVIVALAILGTAGVAIVAQVRESAHVTTRTERAEADVSEASDFLAAVALWPRADLDRHLGDRRNGPWRLVVLRPTDALYDVAIRDSTGTRTLLTTTLFRGQESDAR